MIRRQSLLPPVQNTRDAKIFLVATEGSVTEPRYFRAFNPEETSGPFAPSPIRVQVLPPINGASAPQHVLAQVRSQARDIGLDPRDEVWIVLDVDNWLPHVLAKTIAATRRAKFHVAVSNPCIEVWHCLHFATCNEQAILACCSQGRQAGHALKTLWKSHLPPSATRIERDHLKPHVALAVERAKTLDRGNVSPEQPWPPAPATRVYELVQAILEMETDSPK